MAGGQEDFIRLLNLQGQIEALTVNQAKKLAKSASRGNIEARNKLAMSVAPLVISMCSKHCVGIHSQRFPDMFQHCMERVLQAATRYNPDKATWSTYAYIWVFKGIQEFVKTDHLNHVPRYIQKAVRKGTDRGLYIDQAKQMMRPVLRIEDWIEEFFFPDPFEDVINVEAISRAIYSSVTLDKKEKKCLLDLFFGAGETKVDLEVAEFRSDCMNKLLEEMGYVRE